MPFPLSKEDDLTVCNNYLDLELDDRSYDNIYDIDDDTERNSDNFGRRVAGGLDRIHLLRRPGVETGRI